MVQIPRHVFIRYSENSYKHINWETTEGCIKEDQHYVENFNLKIGSSLRFKEFTVLNDDQIYSSFYNSRGRKEEENKYDEAESLYKKSIAFDPYLHYSYLGLRNIILESVIMKRVMSITIKLLVYIKTMRPLIMV